MPDEPISVLLIDDDEIFHMHIKHVLKKVSGDYRVTWESSSEDGLQAMLHNDFDICLLDFHIDHVDGLELLAQYSAAGKVAPVVFLTGEEREEIDERALALGASDFLIKDRVNGSSLTRSIRYAMHSASLMEQLRIANKRYEDDLIAAAQIQEALLPKLESHIEDYQFDWSYQPSAAVAGDLINYFEIDEHRLGMYCIDVSGHGVPSAMFTVQLSRLITPGVSYSHEGVQLCPDDLLDPCILLGKLNNMFPINHNNFKYFTILYAVVERHTGYVSFATAGHPPPFHIHKDGVVVEIPCSGVPIGMMPDTQYDSYDFVMDAGDSLLVYSDGINEALNEDQEMYGYQRMCECIQNNAVVPQLCSELINEVLAWQDENFEQDDCSILLL
ncbi:MAG: SpoIIE family protein phosphatase, partial [Planctomycetes bacterium]|nr:SpoIIE family protein phosphatase [Planctomycetota bacterium]